MAGEIKTQVQPKNPFANNSLEIVKKNAIMEEQQLLQQQQAINKQIAELRGQLTAFYGQNPVNPNAPQNSQIASLEAQSASLDGRISQARQKQSGLNPDGTPIAPGWTSLTDDQSGLLLDQYKLSELDPTQWDAYQQLKKENMRAPGTQSAWTQIQLQKQAAEEAAAKDAAAKQGMSANSQAMAQLQMRGGMGSGASTSLARDMQRNLLAQRQGVQRQGITARLGISTADEEARQKGLGQLTGYEMDIGKQNKNIQQYNLGNLLKEAEGQRAWQQQQYSEKMKAWAAEKESQATSSGGGGGK